MNITGTNYRERSARAIGQGEHAEAPATVRVVEMVGVSPTGWEDAARMLVARFASRTRHVTGLDLLRSTAVVRDGQIIEYHVTVKITFFEEPAAIDATED